MTERVLLDTNALTISKAGTSVIGLTDQNLMAFSSKFKGFRVRQEGSAMGWIHNDSTSIFGASPALRQGWTITVPFTDTNKMVYMLFAFQLDGSTTKFHWHWTDMISGTVGFVVEQQWNDNLLYLWINGGSTMNFNTRLKLWYTLLETDVAYPV